MKHIKLFENYGEKGFVRVPSDFDDRLRGLSEFTKQKAEIYKIPTNQIKIDLFYGIKSEIMNWLDDVDRGFAERTQDEYENRLNSDIDGILYKFSEGKYTNIKIEDKETIKDLLWNLINGAIPYNEVDYYYTYNLRGKLFTLLDEFVKEILQRGLFT